MGYIKKDFIDRLLDKVIIQDVIGKYIPLKQSGANWKGLSPFSKERTGSFMVSPAKQMWKDFSSGKGGNVVTFVMEHERKSYPEAIEVLAEIYSDTVEYENAEWAVKKQAEIKKKEDLRPILKRVHEHYIEKFLTEVVKNENHPAHKEVFDKRKYTDDIVTEWGIGFAPANYLADILENSGRTKQGHALGLIKEKWDKYSNRVVYPIHDINGLIIGLAGRDLTGKKETAKWINPNVDSENILYNKSKVWFGIHKAKKEIIQKREAWIVEGYNDVIAWHTNGIENTVAPCGTAITQQQITELKRICTKIIFCMDPDDAGIRSMLKYIPEFIQAGFRVEVVVLPCDPDDFVRQYKSSIEKYTLPDMMAEPLVKKDGFLFLMENKLVGDAVDVSRGAQELCKLIAKITDESMSEIYAGWLQKESKVKATTIKKWIKEFSVEVEDHNTDSYRQIELPKNVLVPLAELEKDIRTYGMFQANNQIFMTDGENSDKKIQFTSVSNFAIEILQHMRDEKFPMKLLRIKNVHNLEIIFDTASENLNAFRQFDNAITGHGNFQFKGGHRELVKLRTFLFDKMGNGRKIDMLGWQPDGRFWAWNNKITDEDGSDIPMSPHGIFVKKDVHYYVPSANIIYKNNGLKFDSQKRFRCIPTDIPFETFVSKVIKVHDYHGITAILFAISSLFQDIVVDSIGKFPLLFFFGPGSTGKDELAAIVKSFVGIPQIAINLEGNVSTIKAQVREFAQFKNGVSELSEYKRGNPQLDGVLKGLWDRNGYKRGNIDSHVGTDSVPIESSAVVTGNDFPDAEPLLMRLIWNEMEKNEHTAEETKAFDELRDMTAKGVSGYSNDLFKHRMHYEQNFAEVFRTRKSILQGLYPELKSRIIVNISILMCSYELLKDKTNFPFTQAEMMESFDKSITKQLRKINAASILNRFWDCFIVSLRGNPEDRLEVGKIVNVEGDTLYLQWMHTYAKIQRQWFMQYREAAPGKSVLLDEIKKSGFYSGLIDSYAFSPGRDGIRSSAMAISLAGLHKDVSTTIVATIMFQKNENTLFPSPTIFDSPTSAILSDDTQPDLPF